MCFFPPAPGTLFDKTIIIIVLRKKKPQKAASDDIVQHFRMYMPNISNYTYHVLLTMGHSKANGRMYILTITNFQLAKFTPKDSQLHYCEQERI